MSATTARWRATMRAAPSLLRVGFAETLAYRVEFIIWMLTTTLPLIMLGLWTSVAAEAPFAQFGQKEFVAYYLAALIVRNLTGSWVVWQISDEIRTGHISFRLLRPIHPFVQLAALHLSSVPLRGLIAIPFAVILLLSTGRELLITDPILLAILALSLVGAWLLSFFILVAIGAIAFFVDKAYAAVDVYLGVFAVLSGYMLPLALLPDWLETTAAWAPFRYMLAFPVELAIGFYPDYQHALIDLAFQWAWAAGAMLTCTVIWRAGVRRYEAFGA